MLHVAGALEKIPPFSCFFFFSFFHSLDTLCSPFVFGVVLQSVFLLLNHASEEKEHSETANCAKNEYKPLITSIV